MGNARRGEACIKGRAAQPGDLPFVLAIALLLLTAAVITNLPAFDRLGWPRSLFQSFLWLATVAILLHDARSQRQAEPRVVARMPSASRRPIASFFLKAHRERTIHFLLAIVALFSVASHYHFGRFHRDGHFLHYHDFYHYYIGSKYFPELGYDGLYAATHRALIKNDQSLAGTISVVKNLRTYQLEGKAISLERSASVARLFSEQRWQEFKRDVLFFQSKIPADWWQFLLVDHGFNATPFWTFLGSSFSAHLALNNGTLFLLASFDLLLIAAMLLLVRYAFGTKTALLFAIFFFANFFATFDITGGGFLRQLWLASLIGFVCFLKRNKMGAAGFCLAVSTLDRVFPVLFVLLPVVLVVKHALGRRSLHHGYARLLAAFLCSLVLLCGLSAGTSRGIASWKDWYDKMSAHNRGFYINQISMRNLFIVNPASALEIIDEGWNEASWLRERETLDAQSRNTLQALRAILLVLLLVLIAQHKEADLSLGLLSFAPFVLFYPANYYCIFLAVIIICWQTSFGLALTIQALQIPFWALSTFLSSPVHLELLHWVVSLCLVLAFAAFLSIALVRNAQGDLRFRRTYLLLSVGGALFLVGAVVADVNKAGAEDGWVVLDLGRKDVRSLRGATAHTEQMTDWGSGWSRNDHLVFLVEGPSAQGTVNVPARQSGFYKVKMDYSSGPPFGVITLSVNGQFPCGPVNLFSPQPGILSVVHGRTMLREGTNDFTFTVEGKDRASTDYHFAIDRIVMAKEGVASGPVDAGSRKKSRREALDKAVSWVVDHPADAFDGGRKSVCGEIVTLYWLSSNPHLTGSRSIYLKEIDKRLSKLNSTRGYRTQPEEYEMLVAVAYIAKQLDMDLYAFESVAEKVQEWAESFYKDGAGMRPVFLCEYLNRIKPAEKVPCNIGQTILYREYSGRRVSEMLAGEVDRTKARAVSIALLSIAQDVCALTDFGNEPLPQSDVFADRGFWAQLCEEGIRWGRETGDIVTVARLTLVAKCLGVESGVPWFQGAVDFLVQHQEPDGCFGVSNPYSPNPFRDGVLATIMAIASSL